MPNLRINASICASTLLATVLVSLSAFTVAHAAAIYIWRDADGTRQYSDYCPTGEKCRVKYVGSSDDTGGGGRKKGKSWQTATTTSTDSTDTDTTSTSESTVSNDTANDDTTYDDTTSDTSTTSDTTNDYTPEPVADRTATLDWDAVDDPELGGYRVYYAEAGSYYQNYGQGVDVGDTTSYTVTSLNGGTRYYFRVTAYDTSGNESNFSNEVYKDTL